MKKFKLMRQFFQGTGLQVWGNRHELKTFTPEPWKSFSERWIPPQGLSKARRARSIFEFLVTDPPRERPVGAAAFIVPEE